MNVEILQSFFGWCSLIGYALLLLWTLLFRFARDWHFGLTRSFFKEITRETYDNVNLFGLATFKIAVIILFLIPYMALLIVR